MKLMTFAATIDMMRRRAKVGWAATLFLLLMSPGALIVAMVRASHGGTGWEVLGWGVASGYGLGVMPFLFLNNAVLARNETLIDVLLTRQGERPRDLSKVPDDELLAMAKENDDALAAYKEDGPP